MITSTISCHQPDLCSGASSLPIAAFASSVQMLTQKKRQRTSYDNSFDLTDPWKGVQVPSGICRKYFDNCHIKYMLVMINNAQKQVEAFTSCYK